MKRFFKEHWQHNRQLIFVAITAFILFAGFLQVAFGLSYVLRVLPILLTVLVSIAVIFWDAPIKPKLIASGIVVVSTYILEVIGVNTGLLFGDYSYSNLLGFKLFGVPVTIGLTWLLVTLSAWHIVAFNKNTTTLQKFLLGGVLVVMFDLILEQFATAYGLWAWKGDIPLYNYICWFVIGIGCFAVFKWLTPKFTPSIYIASLLPLMGIFFWLMLVIA